MWRRLAGIGACGNLLNRWLNINNHGLTLDMRLCFSIDAKAQSPRRKAQRISGGKVRKESLRDLMSYPNVLY